MLRRTWLTAALAVGAAVGLTGTATGDPPATVPGGPCIEESQNVSLSSLPSYDEVGRQLRSIEASSHGAVEVNSAGLSGEAYHFCRVGDAAHGVRCKRERDHACLR